MDLSRLFSRQRWPRTPQLAVYPNLRGELDAVQSNRKGMSIFCFSMAEIASGAPQYRDLLAHALRRNLVCAIANSELGVLDQRSANVYIARADQLWRVPAHLALWTTATAAGWRDSSEALEGLLLGYTTAERTRWLAARRERYAGERGLNVYALLTRAQKQAIVAAGKRYLGDTSKLTLFAHVDQRLVDRRAARRLPAHVTLARFALDGAIYRRLFRTSPKRGVVAASVPSKLAPSLHAAMHSNVQFLARRGWV